MLHPHQQTQTTTPTYTVVNKQQKKNQPVKAVEDEPMQAPAEE